MTKYIALNPIGTWSTIDNETAGFWTTFDEQTEGGLWIRSDGGDNGTWIYDSEESSAIGTWQNTNQTSKGNWYTAPPTEEGEEADPLIRIVEVIPDCFNTNFDLLDSGKLNCSRYDSTPDQCGNFDTAAGFVASYMCCSCGGGSNTEMTTEELTDRLAELTATEYESNFNLDYFTQFPRVIEFDCDNDKTT